LLFSKTPSKEDKMKGMMIKSVLMMSLVAGLLVISAAPSALAQGRSNCRNGNRDSVYYDQNRYGSNDRYRDSVYYDQNRYGRDGGFYQRDAYYQGDSYYQNNRRWGRDRENTTGKAVKRVGIGTAIGAGGGALIGGKKGAIIGAAVGAAGGYIYHRNKVNDGRFRWPF
jgi:hypothetical protein